MIDILIGIGILIVIESILITIIMRWPLFESSSIAVQAIQTISVVSALVVGLLILIAVISLACAFIARSLPEFAEILK